MDFTQYFQPVQTSQFEMPTGKTGSLLSILSVNEGKFPDLVPGTPVLLGIKGKNDPTPANQVRKWLYKLNPLPSFNRIADLGDIEYNGSEKQSEQLGYVISELIDQGTFPVILSAHQYTTYAQYLAFAYLKKIANIVNIDARIDYMSNETAELADHNFLQKLLLDSPSHIFNLTQVGYQTYFTDPGVIEMMKNLYFDLYRLGTVRKKFLNIEPVFRDADLLSFDLSAIRYADAPGTPDPSPNGFFAQEACLLARYAGLSNRLKTIGIYNLVPANDP